MFVLIHSMTPQQISLVKSSWKHFRQVEPVAVGDLFYSHLIQKNPSLKSIFKYSLERQSKLLFDFLSTIITRLDRIHDVEDDIRLVAATYAGYGILPEHYEMIRSALLWTLEKGLEKDWTVSVEDAWQAGSIEVMHIMKNAMNN